MDAYGVDVALTASQKALGTPPGLCVVMASSRAMKVFESRKSPVTSYYASWKNWAPIMRLYAERKPCYFATPPVQLIKALHASLKLIVSQPVEKRFEQHAAASNFVKSTLNKWGLKLVPERSAAANTLTAVYYPEGIKAPDFLKAVSAEGIVLAGGLHPLIAQKYFRIGHMGYSVVQEGQPDIHKTISALEKALKGLGHKF
jgi:alanine-glyoxylate transaminase/serine-glyoxylate transaminase/serine-pyruvate transaminase